MPDSATQLWPFNNWFTNVEVFPLICNYTILAPLTAQAFSNLVLSSAAKAPFDLVFQQDFSLEFAIDEKKCFVPWYYLMALFLPTIPLEIF